MVVALAVLAAVCTAAVPFGVASTAGFADRAERVTARVVDRDCVYAPTRVSGGRGDCTTTLSFIVGGERHRVRWSGSRLTEGSRVDVLVDPDDPGDARPLEVGTGAGTVLALAAVTCTAAAVVIAGRARPGRVSSQWGVPLGAAAGGFVGSLAAGATGVSDGGGVAFVAVAAALASAVAAVFGRVWGR